MSVKTSTIMDQQFVSITFSSASDRIKALTFATFKVLEILNQEEATDQEVDQLKLIQGGCLGKNLQNNKYWLAALALRTDKNLSIDGIQRMQAVIESMTTQDVSRTLKQISTKSHCTILHSSQ